MVDRHHPGKAPTALLQRLSGGLCLTIDQLADDLDLTNRQVSDAAANLLRRDYLDRMALGCYQLTEAGEQAARAGEVITSGPKGTRDSHQLVRNTLRQRAWSAMRVRGQFTVPDLVSDASTPGDGNPADNLQRYLRGLKSAGYVVELPRRAAGTKMTSNGFKLFALNRYTGPKAPSVLPGRNGIHDFNLRKDVPCIPR
ncbi:hypothetical protein [Pseudorhodobacter sp.]|uniref:hypothetical protein n=1 Tax=Pseudorhodobacter sp. TaxID=1934400 RepID=UPI0026473BF9|nr:hypothetical protein [Pseudorhodobacter sp.]MDN5785719.1 hypothetical protein [Pseudorhodobacter sp.]